MKTKFHKLLIAIAGLLLSVSAYAYSFEVDGIYYEQTSDTNKTVSVTRGNDRYSGEVIIPETVTYSETTYSVTSIGDEAFYRCTGLTSITIPNSVTTIGEYAFYDCTGLKSITIPNSVTTIGEYAFYDCTGLKSITIPNSVTTIGDYAFYRCTGLTSITIPNSVTTIGDNTFNGCSNLISVSIGTGVINIGSMAFYNCNLKKAIWLTNTPPSGYKNVSSSVNYVANDQYTELSNVTVYPYLSSIFEVDGVKYVPVSPSERICDAIDCAYDSTSTIINIGNTVSYKGVAMTLNDIKPYTCYNNDYIKNCSINYSSSIGNYAFYGCGAITSATISATTIGDNAFYGCNAITSAIVNADTIGNNAFYRCSAMETITIGNAASIGTSAFDHCSRLKTINIPNSVETLGASAFRYCSALESISIGTGVTTIKYNTFSGCSSLLAITIPNNVTSIGDYVFDNCVSLETVTIADRDIELSLGYNGSSSPLFKDCPLKSVYIGGNITYETSSSYGYSPFYRNTTLESVVITDNETEISENEFYGCTALKSITMGDGIETIGNWAFSGCSSLDFFSFGSGLKSIGDEAFSDCTALTKLYSKTTTPPTCGTQALDDINKWNCELYVPQASIAAYQAADQWKEFFFIKDIESGVDDVVADGDAVSVTANGGNIVISGIDNGSTVEIYNLGGQLIYSGTDMVIPVETAGLYIVKVADKTFKVII